MRTKIYALLTRPIVVLLVIIANITLTLTSGNYGYFFALAAVLIAIWASRWKWSDFGIGPVNWGSSIFAALKYAVLIFLAVDVVVQPLLETLVGDIDLSALDGIRGNVTAYLVFLVIMWVMAAVGEELIFRGYFMKQIAAMLGNGNQAWILAALMSSMVFGMAHYYQGLSGIMTTGIIGFALALIFMKHRNNLTVAILTHGFYDMIGITLLYLSKERLIVDWVQGLLGA